MKRGDDMVPRRGRGLDLFTLLVKPNDDLVNRNRSNFTHVQLAGYGLYTMLGDVLVGRWYSQKMIITLHSLAVQ